MDQSGFAHIPAQRQREESKQSPNGREFKYRKEFESSIEYAGGAHEYVGENGQNKGKEEKCSGTDESIDSAHAIELEEGLFPVRC